MIIGVTKEIKEGEFRVSATPVGVAALVARGHEVVVQADAGAGPGFSDDDYRSAGATILPGRVIGAGALVGAGAIVAKDVPSGAVVVGNPSRVVAQVTDLRYRDTGDPVY